MFNQVKVCLDAVLIGRTISNVTIIPHFITGLYTMGDDLAKNWLKDINVKNIDNLLRLHFNILCLFNQLSPVYMIV